MLVEFNPKLSTGTFATKSTSWVDVDKIFVELVWVPNPEATNGVGDGAGGVGGSPTCTLNGFPEPVMVPVSALIQALTGFVTPLKNASPVVSMVPESLLVVVIAPGVVALNVTFPLGPVAESTELGPRLRVNASDGRLLWIARSPVVAEIVLFVLSVGVVNVTVLPVAGAFTLRESAALLPVVRSSDPDAVMPLVTITPAPPVAEILPLLVMAPNVRFPVEVVTLNGSPVPVTVPII